MAEDDVYVPLSTVLSERVWPSDYFGSADFSFLDKVAYVAGEIVDDEFEFSARVDLEVMESVKFDLPAGLQLVAGEGPINGSFVVEPNGEDFEAAISADVLALRFPRDILIPILDGTNEPDPDPTHYTEIALPLGVRFDNHFNLEVDFPAGPVGPGRRGPGVDGASRQGPWGPGDGGPGVDGASKYRPLTR